MISESSSAIYSFLHKGNICCFYAFWGVSSVHQITTTKVDVLKSCVSTAMMHSYSTGMSKIIWARYGLGDECERKLHRWYVVECFQSVFNLYGCFLRVTYVHVWLIWDVLNIYSNPGCGLKSRSIATVSNQMQVRVAWNCRHICGTKGWKTQYFCCVLFSIFIYVHRIITSMHANLKNSLFGYWINPEGQKCDPFTMVVWKWNILL